jgi:hypothetical protein
MWTDTHMGMDTDTRGYTGSHLKDFPVADWAH